MNTDDALLLVRVAESLSFKTAAAQLGISRSAASKRIALLEKALGATLINRTPRSLSLTHAGAVVLEQCRKMCEAVDAVQQAIHGHGLQPVGRLHVALPTPLAVALMPALTHEFAVSYPKVALSVHVVDGEVDVVGGGYDVVFAVSRQLADSSLSAHRLAKTQNVLAASPTYLQRNGTPAGPGELRRHRCLGVGYATNRAATWRFYETEPVDVEVRYAMTFNNFLLLTLAAREGMGFIYVPELYIHMEILRGQLKAVLPTCTAALESGLFAIYPRRSPPEKVRALVDFVKARLICMSEPATAEAWPYLTSAEYA